MNVIPACGGLKMLRPTVQVAVQGQQVGPVGPRKGGVVQLVLEWRGHAAHGRVAVVLGGVLFVPRSTVLEPNLGARGGALGPGVSTTVRLQHFMD